MVAQRIVKDENYRMFHFDSSTAAPRHLVLRYQGQVTSSETNMSLQKIKKCVVSVQIDQHNVLKSVRVDSDDGGTVISSFPMGSFEEFSSSVSQSTIMENEPFLTLNGPGRHLQLVITP